MLAALYVNEVWQADRLAEAKSVYRTTNLHHPGVSYLLEQTHPWYAEGTLEGIHLPSHYDFRTLRLTPADCGPIHLLGWRRIVGFQTRNPMHRAHQELTLRAAKELEANLLIHPSVGMTKPRNVEYYVRSDVIRHFFQTTRKTR